MILTYSQILVFKNNVSNSSLEKVWSRCNAQVRLRIVVTERDMISHPRAQIECNNVQAPIAYSLMVLSMELFSRRR